MPEIVYILRLFLILKYKNYTHGKTKMRLYQCCLYKMTKVIIPIKTKLVFTDKSLKTRIQSETDCASFQVEPGYSLISFKWWRYRNFISYRLILLCGNHGGISANSEPFAPIQHWNSCSITQKETDCKNTELYRTSSTFRYIITFHAKQN